MGENSITTSSNYIQTVPNQRVITVKKAPADREHLYSSINLQAMEKACNTLQSKAGIKDSSAVSPTCINPLVTPICAAQSMRLSYSASVTLRSISEKPESEWQSRKAKVNPAETIYTHVPKWTTTKMDKWYLPSTDSGGGKGDDVNRPHERHFEDYDDGYYQGYNIKQPLMFFWLNIT